MKGEAREQILIVEDEENILHFLVRLFEREGYAVEASRTAEEALEKLAEVPIDLIISDIRLPGADGLDVLKRAKDVRQETDVILITAYGSIPSAIEAMKAGAYDYVTKPFRAEEILKVARQALERAGLRREVRTLRREVERRYSFASLVGKSDRMQQLYRQIEKVASARGTVLITGESGTGKELVARAIHYNSGRKGSPFVVIDCGAIPESLQESELFGHVKGAFTGAIATRRGLFEEADGGSLFLDEVSELAPSAQVKLLRALQDGTIRKVGDPRLVQVDVRVIAATNRDLGPEVRGGRFREDLFYRLNVLPIHLPPLRERREDIPLLADHFLKKYATEAGRPINGLSAEARDLVVAYGWPGNVRELENVIERAVLYCEGGVITPAELPTELKARDEAVRVDLPDGPFNLKAAVAEASARVERRLIEKALERCGRNRSAAARLLGISRRGLLYKLKEHGLSDDEEV